MNNYIDTFTSPEIFIANAYLSTKLRQCNTTYITLARTSTEYKQMVPFIKPVYKQLFPIMPAEIIPVDSDNKCMFVLLLKDTYESIERHIERISILKPAIEEMYVRRSMHPRHLQPLLDDPTIVVDEFITAYIDTL